MPSDPPPARTPPDDDRAGSEPRYASGAVVANRYELRQPRGRGGMGTIWVARDRVLDVEVALKVIDLTAAPESSTVASRLLDEARAAARLGHPSIVRVHDFGKTTLGDPFLAMELLEGEDLAAVLAREYQIAATRAAQLLLPIADALAAAHAKGIVHRDVKPENIFLTEEAATLVPKLLDFGIARTLDRPRKLTLEGSVLGTPDYMSPEQARGEPAGAATDQWSLCVVLYELVSGVCPFEGKNYNALLRNIIEVPAKSLAQRGVEEPKLWRILARGLNKQPEARFDSMWALGQALAAWLVDGGTTVDARGTSLGARWFVDGVLPSSTTSTDLPSPPSSSRLPHSSSEDELAAIAELNRGGDPVELFVASERRRNLWAAALMTLAAVGVTLGLLAGLGYLG